MLRRVHEQNKGESVAIVSKPDFVREEFITVDSSLIIVRNDAPEKLLNALELQVAGSVPMQSQ